MPTPLTTQLGALDTRLLDYVESQTSAEDKRSLLALHGACRDVFGRFTYLEIGSYLGGSLQSFIADPHCKSIVSIDPRPGIAPDERWQEGCEYADNSTERMLGLLAQVPGADFGKLQTIEASTEEISAAEIADAPSLCFIDGEHTNPAALRDADFCRAVMSSPGVIAFHDTPYVAPAIGRFLARSGGFGYPLRDTLFAVEFGGTQIFNHPLIRRMALCRREWIWTNRLGIADRFTADSSPVMAMRNRFPVRTQARRLLRIRA